MRSLARGRARAAATASPALRRGRTPDGRSSRIGVTAAAAEAPPFLRRWRRGLWSHVASSSGAKTMSRLISRLVIVAEAAALVVVAVSGFIVVRSLLGNTNAAFRSWYVAQPRHAAPPFVSPGAVTLVEFVDYQCRPCRDALRVFGPVLASFAAKHPGLLSVRTLHFPLEAECNPGARARNHGLACEAAAVVVASEKQGRARA